jgi:hypothetical protein
MLWSVLGGALMLALAALDILALLGATSGFTWPLALAVAFGHVLMTSVAGFLLKPAETALYDTNRERVVASGSRALRVLGGVLLLGTLCVPLFPILATDASHARTFAAFTALVATGLLAACTWNVSYYMQSVALQADALAGAGSVVRRTGAAIVTRLQSLALQLALFILELLSAPLRLILERGRREDQVQRPPTP